MTIYKQNTRGLLLPSRGLRRGADNIRPNTASEGSYTLDPSGPVFEAGVIHAWNPDAGADASGIIADAVGSANMWARTGASAAANWAGALTGAEALCVDNADISDFKSIATPTLTFWLNEDAGSPSFASLGGMCAVGYLPGGGADKGDVWFARAGASSDVQFAIQIGYAASNTSSGRNMAPGVWNLWSIRLGPNKWRMLRNGSAILASVSYSSQAFAGNTKPLILAHAPGMADHTGTFGSGLMRGRIGDVRMWSASLSDAELDALYAAGRQSW